MKTDWSRTKNSNFPLQLLLLIGPLSIHDNFLSRSRNGDLQARRCGGCCLLRTTTAGGVLGADATPRRCPTPGGSRRKTIQTPTLRTRGTHTRSCSSGSFSITTSLSLQKMVSLSSHVTSDQCYFFQLCGKLHICIKFTKLAVSFCSTYINCKNRVYLYCM